MTTPRSRTIAALLVMAASTALAEDIPTTPLPRPRGPYAVGTRIVDFRDPSRHDLATGAGVREIPVQLWYPAAASNAPLERYIPNDSEARFLRGKGYYGVAANEIDWWCSMPTHAARGAAVMTGRRFPLVTFSIGAGVARFSYTSILEEMASHGYIVAAIDHPYGAVTALADGRVISAADVKDRGDDEATSAEVTEEWAQDIRFVVRALLADRRLAPHIDRRHIGALGHSLGGTAALEAARLDRSIAAAADMDGGLFGEIARVGLDKPALILRSSPLYSDEELAKRGRTRKQWNDTSAVFDAQFRAFFGKHPGTRGYVIKVRRTGHFSFSDAPFVMPSTITRFGGSILDAATTYERVTDCLLAFFDQELLGRRSAFLVTHEDAAFAVEKFPAASVAR